ncbi:hypothetical protein D3C76_1187800 [compost metagenome]
MPLVEEHPGPADVGVRQLADQSDQFVDAHAHRIEHERSEPGDSQSDWIPHSDGTKRRVRQAHRPFDAFDESKDRHQSARYGPELGDQRHRRHRSEHLEWGEQNVLEHVVEDPADHLGEEAASLRDDAVADLIYGRYVREQEQRHDGGDEARL